MSQTIASKRHPAFSTLRNHVLRGGRMVKTARGAASIAPLVVAGGIILGAGGAQAACTVDDGTQLTAQGAGTVCNASSTTYTGTASQGVIFAQNGVATGTSNPTIINGPAIVSVINTSGVGVQAIRAGQINIGSFGNVLEINASGVGVQALSSQGRFPTSVNLAGNVEITTTEYSIVAFAGTFSHPSGDFGTADDRNASVVVDGNLVINGGEGIRAREGGRIELQRVSGFVDVQNSALLDAKGATLVSYASTIDPIIGGSVSTDEVDITVATTGNGAGIRAFGVGATVEIGGGSISVEETPNTQIPGSGNMGIRALLDGEVSVSGYINIKNDFDQFQGAVGDGGIGIYAHDGGVVRVGTGASGPRGAEIVTSGIRGHGIQVGKDQAGEDYEPLNDGGPGTVIVNGTLDITTNDDTAHAIHVQGRGTLLDATGASTSIDAAGSAIVFGAGSSANDLDTVGTVRLTDATIKTRSMTEALVFVSGMDNQSSLIVDGQSNLEAGADGWLVNVDDSVMTNRGPNSNRGPQNDTTNAIDEAGQNFFTFDVSGESVLTGSMTMSDGNQFNLQMDDTAEWNIEGRNGNRSETSRLTSVSMRQDAVINAAEGGLANYTIRVDNDLSGGTLQLRDGFAGDVLTIDGDLGATKVELDVVLGDDASPTDRLVVTGDTSGSSTLSVNQVGGSGAGTTEGILLVQVDGASNGRFALDAPLVTGAYEYGLFQGGVLSPTDGDWYLRSAGFQPGAPVYEALPSVLLGLNTVGTLAQRIEGRQVLTERGNSPSTIASRGATGMAGQPVLSDAWLRIEGNRTDLTPATSSTGLSYDQDTWRLQGGLDTMVYEGDGGSLVAGINVFTGGSSVSVISPVGGGDIATDATGVGLTATWYGNQGFYADAQLQYTSLESELSSAVLGFLTSGLDGSGRLASIEMGQEFALPSEITLTPQAQLTWSEVNFDSFTGPNGEAVSLGDNDSLQLRLGLAAEQSWDFNDGSQAQLYGIANVTHEMRDTTSVMVSGTELAMSAPDWVGEVGLGGSYDWAGESGGTSSLYGEVSASRELSDGKMRGLSGTVGFRMEF